MKKILRVLDANANRAMEGIRVVEEIARFILEDPKLTAETKTLRAQLKQAVSCLKAEKSREAGKDIGARLYTESEGKRKNLSDIFKSNIKRGQEALRSLEEFSKLIDASLGKKFKALRFKLYEIETMMEPKVLKAVKLDFEVYLVTDPMRDHIKIVKEAIKAGIKIVQLRDKFASKAKYLQLAKKVQKLTRQAGVVFIVNDSVEVAKKVDADGVHLGQKDGNPKKARKILGPDKLIGVSTHNLAEALKAQRAGADYIAIGNIFETPSKPGKNGIGAQKLKVISEKLKVPVVAIGGINRNNISKIKAVGIDRVAAIRGALDLLKSA
ncbi:thiamine-phosphate diphosphorylase [candidate division WOR-1 bacterium RIFOXYA12_FULL_43_27]|uniref:Thiamine-phosphate synthase n=1 Tax=candidate division WOR-1 bacterium RIFOXYC2_FULL_46_14 TaxID=1802587 RepID=A0A1F4U5Y6_UNCSA|nr:MAG: thiamine-phosphate diphosphorylase [candidate division WOR-1 bacterium RIFOXYA12_FULL_43_27]OGC20384.1 MAG: thiamine-phosphate diphosphorylase [candidate division WOR-1 bacterium RIFOXYB2_FULL_46_45]OGC31879.1 MAG: thiamine-phosphate diphosphorylase [candidate division WOR-1 bacterium RIFOXYA2_FULL_46_56]OGC40230.1 MAG: thiamine-phosphate diphosphorylase [candidate division WOR-1 bacterium RIFOXYC2_FULL_46_14]